MLLIKSVYDISKFKSSNTHSKYELGVKNEFVENILNFQPLESKHKGTSKLHKLSKSEVIEKNNCSM